MGRYELSAKKYFARNLMNACLGDFGDIFSSQQRSFSPYFKPPETENPHFITTKKHRNRNIKQQTMASLTSQTDERTASVNSSNDKDIVMAVYQLRRAAAGKEMFEVLEWHPEFEPRLKQAAAVLKQGSH